MKYLLVFAVVLVAIYLWRQGRREEMRDKPRPPKAIPAPQAMVRCAHCGMHLPAADAVPGARGALYCSGAHRQAARP